jgi:hypothetical protein
LATVVSALDMAFNFSKSTPNNFPTEMSCSQMIFFFPTSNLQKAKNKTVSHLSMPSLLLLLPPPPPPPQSH